MHAGKLVHWEKLQLRVALSASESVSGGFGATAGANLQSYVAPNVVDLATGIVLGCSTQTADAPGGARHQYTVQIPALLISDTVTDSGWDGSLETTLEFGEFRLYGLNGGGWRVAWDSLDWYVEGVLETAYGDGELIAAYFAPAGIPLMGVPPRLEAGADLTPDPAVGTVVDANFDYTSSAVGSGGWRFYDNGDWRTLPVTPGPLLELPETPAPCTCDDAEVGGATAATTWDGEASAYARYRSVKGTDTEYICTECTNGPAAVPFVFDVHDSTTSVERRAGSITLIPDLTKALERFQPDYRAMWYRGGFPATTTNAYAECWEEPTPSDPPRTDVSEEVHPAYSELLSVVGDAAHVIEDPLAEVTYAPRAVSGYRWAAVKTFSTMTSPGACPPDEPGGD
jgi:hypothetical protein